MSLATVKQPEHRPRAAAAEAPAAGRPLRVGFVVHVMQVAGAEVLVAETIRRLKGQIAPTVFCLDDIGRIGEQLRAEGVDVVCLGRRPGRDWRVAWRLARAVSSRQVDVLHAHQYTPFFYSALARCLLAGRVRLVLTEHGRHYPDVVRPLRRAVNRLVLNHLANAVNACCRFSADGLSVVDGFAARRIEVIENGIDISRYQPVSDRGELRRRLGLDPARRYVVCVARFHPVKDHATLLWAFAAVAKHRPDVELLLAGDGPLRGELELLTGELGVSGRVHFLGVRGDVPDVLRAADVFALTSVSEAASLTLLEAMASNLPVVVTNVGGNPEIVRDGVEGWLVPRGDAAAAAGALGRLLDDPPQRMTMGRAGRARVEERYLLQRTIDSYYNLYRRLAGR
jgi:glycosyltransferase involved in cell wall biosynthesis